MSDQKPKKKLTVVECSEHAVWRNHGGKSETVLYAVKAVDEEGKPWEPRPLRSFALLEVGVPIEYTVEPYEHPKTGEKSITLKQPRHTTKAQVKHLEERLDELAARVAALEGAATPKAGGLPDMPQGPWGKANLRG